MQAERAGQGYLRFLIFENIYTQIYKANLNYAFLNVRIKIRIENSKSKIYFRSKSQNIFFRSKNFLFSLVLFFHF
jgi:hypothetical protein